MRAIEITEESTQGYRSVEEARRNLLETLAPLLSRFRKTDGYLGLVVFGSTVERRLDRGPKDIDLIVLTSADVIGRGRATFQGLTLDVTLRPHLVSINEILSRRSLFDVRTIASGILVDWTNPAAPLIKKAAEASWRDGPPLPNPLERMLMRERWRAWANFSAAETVLFPVKLAAAQAAVRDYHSSFGLHMTKWSYLPERMNVIAPELWRHVEFCLDSPPPKTHPAIRKLASYMVSIVGDKPPSAWIMHGGESDQRNPHRDQTLDAILARYPPPVGTLCSSGNVVAVLESNVSGRPLLTILDRECSCRERGMFGHKGGRWRIERTSLHEAIRSFGGISDPGIDHRILDFSTIWSQSGSEKILRDWLDLARRKNLSRCPPMEESILRREPVTLLGQVRELESKGREIEARYVAGAAFQKSLQAWFRLRGLKNFDDDYEGISYVSFADRNLWKVIASSFLDYEAGRGSLSSAIDGIVEAVLQPAGGPIREDWCYPADLWRHLGLDGLQ